MNKEKNHDASNDAALEAAIRLKKIVAYLRYEWIQKSVEELNLDKNTYGTQTIFPVNSTTIGAGYDLFHISKVRVMGGGQLSWYHADNKLESLYGKNPIAGEIYIRLYPGLM